MSDPAKSPASKLLLALRARKSQARKAGAAPSPSGDCAGVQQLSPRPVKEEPPVNTSRSLEAEFENIQLEKLEDIEVEEEKVVVEDIKVEEEEETRKKIYAKLMMAREKLARAKNQKEMLRELYETRKKESGSNDWRDWSFEDMRDEYVR